MSIIPSKNSTNIITGEGGLNLDDLGTYEVPYKAPDGTLQSSGLRMLTSGSLLAPVGFSVESGSIDFGDVLRLSESAGFLAFDNMVDRVRYQLVDYAVPRDAPSSKPYYFKLTEAEKLFEASSGTSVITTNPLTFEYTTRLTARTNSLVFKATQVMNNVRIKITDKASGIVVKYFPSKSSWLVGQGGTTFEVGDNVIDFQDTSLIFQAGVDLIYDIQADNIALSGTNGIPAISAKLQRGSFVAIVDSNDLASLQTQLDQVLTPFSGDYSDLINVPTTFSPSSHTHSISDVVGLGSQLSSLAQSVATANSSLSSLGSVAFTNSYNDLNNKPVLFSGLYEDLTNKPVLFDGKFSSLSGLPSSFTPAPHTHVISDTVDLQAALDSKLNTNSAIPYSQISGTPTVVSKTSQLTNDSGFISNVVFPVSSVNGKIGSVVLNYDEVGAAPSNHTHTIQQVVGLQASLDSKINSGSSIPYGSLTGTPDIPVNASFTFKGLSDTDDNVLANGYLVWNSLGNNIVYSTTIPFTSISGKPTTVAGYGITDGVSSSSLSSSLSNYVTVSAQTSALANYVTSTSLASSLSSYASTASLLSGLASKYNNPTGSTSQYVRGDGSLATLPIVPANVSAFSNDAGYLTSITQTMVNNALGYTPYNATNPIGYINLAGARAGLSLTTTGFGAATYNSTTGVINVPTPVRTFTNPTRTLNSVFQISPTQDTKVSYAVDITVQALLIAGSSGRVYLEYANDSGFTSGITTVTSSGTSTGGVLSITTLGTASLCGMIPAGKYVRLRTAVVSGAPTFAFVSAQEVLF